MRLHPKLPYATSSGASHPSMLSCVGNLVACNLHAARLLLSARCADNAAKQHHQSTLQPFTKQLALQGSYMVRADAVSIRSCMPCDTYCSHVPQPWGKPARLAGRGPGWGKAVMAACTAQSSTTHQQGTGTSVPHDAACAYAAGLASTMLLLPPTHTLTTVCNRPPLQPPNHQDAWLSMPSAPTGPHPPHHCCVAAPAHIAIQGPGGPDGI